MRSHKGYLKKENCETRNNKNEIRKTSGKNFWITSSVKLVSSLSIFPRALFIHNLDCRLSHSYLPDFRSWRAKRILQVFKSIDFPTKFTKSIYYSDAMFQIWTFRASRGHPSEHAPIMKPVNPGHAATLGRKRFS